MEPISACIISFNEEEHLGKCLDSLDFCDEIIVLDSGSTDRTREIALEKGVRFEVNTPFPGHVEQKNLVLGMASHDWVLCLDCDERISPELRSRILSCRDSGFPDYKGFSMPRLNWYLGKPIRHGAFWPDRKLRLFRRDAGHWGGTNPHDRVELDGPVKKWSEVIVHYPYRDLSDHLNTIDKFTAIAAKALHEQGRKANLLDIWLRPIGFFMKSYLFKLGLLDGWRGIYIAALGARYTHMKWSRLSALVRNGGGA